MLSTIIRYHDRARDSELSLSLFSLAGQFFRPITVHIVCQRFNDDELSHTKALAREILSLSEDICFFVHNYTDDLPNDARSALLNLGIKKSTKRYLAFLDYDDILYPETYQILISELKNTSAAIAFGGVAAKHNTVKDRAVITEYKSHTFQGNDLYDLFRGNFCPIHSYIIDTDSANKDDTYFNETLSEFEDYYFLLRFCSRYPASFRKLNKIIADYSIKDDGSNTVSIRQNTEEKRKRWKYAEHYISNLKNNLQISLPVQESLCLDPEPKLTVSSLIEKERKV